MIIVFMLPFICWLCLFGVKDNVKTVAFRIGAKASYVDYDLELAIKSLEKEFFENGYKILGRSYSGNLYPKNLDEADVNVYVRGFENFYDKRLNENSINIFYVHRVVTMFLQEYDGFDYYFVSQKKMLDDIDGIKNIEYFDSDYVYHDRLVADYKYDVLFIYEMGKNDLINYANLFNAKVFDTGKFWELSENEREDLLKSAKVVVYAVNILGSDDSDYIPFAVLDIASYGRPLVVEYNKKLNKILPNLLMYKNAEEMAIAIQNAIRFDDSKREEIAADMRNLLIKKNFNNLSFFEKNK